MVGLFSLQLGEKTLQTNLSFAGELAKTSSCSA
ncbi:hypothetical protein P781_02890 [Vibrio mimicus CAIM 1883]|nr:hypothetical protein P781_02890 [Vibrio mimicus CAIM 1883]ERM62808.1 hypothetical protein P780_02875 [Vibrio mimicus CAIM 1882]